MAIMPEEATTYPQLQKAMGRLSMYGGFAIASATNAIHSAISAYRIHKNIPQKFGIFDNPSKKEVQEAIEEENRKNR